MFTSEDHTLSVTKQQILEQRMSFVHDMNRMVQESKFLLESYHTGYIPVNEAVTKNAGFLKSLVETGIKFLESLSRRAREKMIQKWKEEYGADTMEALKANMDQIKKNATKMQPKKAYPYWEANYQQDFTSLMSAMNTAIGNVKGGKVDDFSWAAPFVGGENVSKVDKRDGDIREMLKNYFRCNKTGVVKGNTLAVSFSGSDCAKRVESMIDYIDKYHGTTSNYLGQLAQRYKNLTVNLDQIANTKNVVTKVKANEESKKEGTTEGIQLTTDTYLMVEGRPVCESYLPFMFNYTTVVEATNDGKTDTQGQTGTQTQNQNQTKTQTKETGENDIRPGQVQNDKSAKQEKTQEEKKEEEKEKTEETKETNLTTDKLIEDYIKTVQYFFELAASAYQLALEERFLVYSKLLREIAGDYFKKTDEKEKQERAEQTNPNKVTDEDKKIENK